MQVLNVYFNEIPYVSNPMHSIRPLGSILSLIAMEDEMQRSYGVDSARDLVKSDKSLVNAIVSGTVKTLKPYIDPNEENPLCFPIINRNDQKLILNLYGCGRGASIILMIANKLKKYTADQVEINMVVFDPLPIFDIPLVDLSQSTNIKKVLFLYTESMNTLTHAPLPYLHASTFYRVDVIPGNHRYAQEFRLDTNDILPRDSRNPYGEQKESILSFQSVVHFLEGCGTRFNFDKHKMNSIYKNNREENKQFLMETFEACKNSFVGKAMQMGPACIINPNGQYLNRFHQELSTGQPVFDTSRCVLSLKNENPPTGNPHPFSRVFNNNAVTPLSKSAVMYDGSVIEPDNAVIERSHEQKSGCSIC